MKGKGQVNGHAEWNKAYERVLDYKKKKEFFCSTSLFYSCLLKIEAYFIHTVKYRL